MTTPSFHRWSSPELSMPEVPFAAATERADTMAAHIPPSFTVYTPDQVRSAPYRRSLVAYEELQAESTERLGARVLLKWTGIGIVAGLAVLAALIFLVGVTDRANPFGGSNARATLKIEQPVAAAPPPVVQPKPAEPAASATVAKKAAVVPASKQALKKKR